MLIEYEFPLGAAHVIPIQFVGVQDCEEAKMTTNEVLLYALANADDDRYGREGGYAIIHSGLCLTYQGRVNLSML